MERKMGIADAVKLHWQLFDVKTNTENYILRFIVSCIVYVWCIKQLQRITWCLLAKHQIGYIDNEGLSTAHVQQ